MGNGNHKVELLRKLKRQAFTIRFCSWSLFSMVLLTWLVFGIWAVKGYLAKKKKNDKDFLGQIEKTFCHLLIFSLVFSLLAYIVFGFLWSIWNTGAGLAELV